MNSKVLLIFLIPLLLLISACGKDIPDCSTQDSTYEKYRYSEDLEQCVVSESLQRDVCGNGVVEDDETACNCPRDVSINLPIEQGGCSGSKGEFLEYYCAESSRTCELQVTENVKEKSANPIFNKGTDFSFDSKIAYSQPFMIDRHNVNIDLFFKDFSNSDSIKVKDVVLRRAYVETRDELLGTVDLNKEFTQKFEEYSFEIPLDQFTLDTFDTNYRNVNLRLFFSYTKEVYSGGELIRTEEETADLEESFVTSLDLIDPDNRNEDLEDTSSGWY